jgi:molybdopterin/thiamine biosynthesis adenylyltransferase
MAMKHLVQVGVGSGGIVVLDLVARDPRVSHITLIEPDLYKPHNVHRHLFPVSNVGKIKGELAIQWLAERRPDVTVQLLPVNLHDPQHQSEIQALIANCDVGICAVDNEPAKYHFDQLFRQAGKPWTLGEVLSGGIAGWVHRFWPTGPCYGCVASHLQRERSGSDPSAPAPDYSNPNGPVETTIPASRASIDAIAALHALLTLEFLDRTEPLLPTEFTSLLLPMQKVPGVFDDPFRTYRLAIPRSLSCFLCSVGSPPTGEDLDVALDQALARLGHE